MVSSQGNKHKEWNLWAHGKCTKVSPFLNWSRHIAQSCCSLTLHLNHSINLPRLFFNPTTSVGNSPGGLPFPCSNLFPLSLPFCLNLKIESKVQDRVMSNFWLSWKLPSSFREVSTIKTIRRNLTINSENLLKCAHKSQSGVNTKRDNEIISRQKTISQLYAHVIPHVMN